MRELLATGADVEGSAAHQQLERQARNFKMVRFMLIVWLNS